KGQDDNSKICSWKKDDLPEKDYQRSVVRVLVELQHPSDLPKLEDGFKRLAKPDALINLLLKRLVSILLLVLKN
ncbi:hypothetical protein TNCT_264481, partial [Trichonephila clavata]